MKTVTVSSLDIAEARLLDSYPAHGPDWPRFFKARFEPSNFATRYHFVYPGLAWFARIRNRPDEGVRLRPVLDVMYQGLVDERCWQYWHRDMDETTGAIAERNLTYAGRLAMFVGLYIDAFGEPPAAHIEVDGDSITYSELSERLWHQMVESPSCGVSCYHGEAMVMCNGVLLINNLVHDRLFGTTYAEANEAWLNTVRDNLLTQDPSQPLFYFGTAGESQQPNQNKLSIGMDAWGLALMSAVAPDDVSRWFGHWRHHITVSDGAASVAIGEAEARTELSSTEYATAWTFVLASELGETALRDQLDAYLAPRAVAGFRVDPYMSGLYLLGHELSAGGLRRLVFDSR